MQMFTSYMEGIKFGQDVNFAATLGGCLILCIACLLIVIQLPSIAGALASGVGIGLWSELRIASGMGISSVNGTKAALRGAAASAKVAGRSIVAAGSAANSAGPKALGRFKGSGRNA